MDQNMKNAINQIVEQKLSKIMQKVAKIDEIEQSLASLSDFYDIVKNKVSALEFRFDQAAKDNSILINKMNNWSNELNQVKDVIDDMEQYIRRECLEIKGIPVLDDEDTNEIVRKIGDLIDVDISEDDISVSHRLPTKKNGASSKQTYDPTIIVKFVRRDVRDELYKARKTLRDFNTKDLSFERHEPRNIYVNESLTRKNREIFNKCLQKKKELQYKYIWTNYGKVLLRKDAHSPAIVVTSEKDLNKL